MSTQLDGRKVLALDTSSMAGSVALCCGETVVAESLLNVQKTHSENLFRQVDLLLADSGWRLSDLDLLAAVTGPGSFTGLRIGVAMIKGLGQVLDLPVAAISSLQAVAMNVPLASYPVCACLDARKKEVYAQMFRWDNGLPVATGEAHVLAPEALIEQISSETVFVGNGSQVYRDLLVERLPDRALLAPSTAHQLRAAQVAYLALRNQQSEAPQLKPADMLPTYIRPSDAELNLTSKQGR